MLVISSCTKVTVRVNVFGIPCKCSTGAQLVGFHTVHKLLLVLIFMTSKRWKPKWVSQHFPFFRYIKYILTAFNIRGIVVSIGSRETHNLL